MKRLLIILGILFVLLLSGCENKITGKVTADLSDKSINNGESSSLKIKATNNGKILFPGQFKFSTDNKYVKLEYSDPDKLYFDLYPGESVERVIKINGFADTNRIDSEIKVWIEDSAGKLIDNDAVILTIRK